MSTLYEKRGCRYHPVAEYAALDHLPKGSHLVIVNPGLKLVYCNINPDHAALIAASKDALDAMTAAIQAAMRAEPNQPMTRAQRKAMDQFIAAGGFPLFSRRSAHDIAKAGIDALVQAAARKRAKEDA